MSKNAASLPDWESVLSSAARLPSNAVPAGGMAAAVHAWYSLSRDAGHVLPDLHEHFDEVLAQLESVAGWKAARVKPPVLILGSLDGIETGVRQLIRDEPLETLTVSVGGVQVTLPTEDEILRIKGALILKRNATRDYVDFVALGQKIGAADIGWAMLGFDQFYPQPGGESALQQLQAQLANPMPYDLKTTALSEYKSLDPRWHDWSAMKDACAHIATVIFDRVCDAEDLIDGGRGGEQGR